MRKGFSLVELVVVMVLMGIIASIAIVSYSHLTHKGDDTQSRSAVDRVILAERTFANGFGGYTPWPADLNGVGKDILLVTADASTAASQANGASSNYVISIAVGSQGTLGVATTSQSGSCILRRSTSLQAGSDETTPTLASGSTCTGAAALPSDETPVAAESMRGGS